MNTLLDPALLFFVLGVFAGLLKSNLEVPAPLSRFLSLYLLMALGLKGGFALAQTGFSSSIATALACAVLLAVLVPLLDVQWLKRRLAPHDAWAVAATYGSVSAVTFVTATHILESAGTPAGGYMAAAMALMESPALIIAIAAAHAVRRQTAGGVQTVSIGAGGSATLGGGAPHHSLAPVLREAFTDGGTLLLLGALAIGLLTGSSGAAAMKPFTGDLFKGLLAFFLLDMGLLTARQLGGLRSQPLSLFAYALIAPLLHALLALTLARLAGVKQADGTLLAVLAASASYIAVPAVLRHAMPEAKASVYVGLSLGVTFPFNLIVGIPLYRAMAEAFGLPG
ncbi:sodium-dependent bicarbonate transport family permease [Paucibacter sp. APW11]|uniref:Sodium-dependent bicarbonate transport family permease n=1 Tax=Roseateles aquae TaxID=3077235 RepID=A0ABU3PB80_9BURK|nr:sodium-dependent bicarbonate transport family permease [Paucibacter sp. APW11]MDT8999495.1 sodium-dependent bicarbonate transport family permease [Paucibacter sp. APW11]